MKTNRRNFTAYLPKNGAFYSLLFMFVIFGMASNSFLTISNFFNVSRQMSSTAIITMCSFLAILTNQTDLSVGATAGLTGVVASIAMVNYNLPTWMAIILAILVGLLVGLVNGILSGKTDIPSFIITLGTMSIVESVGIILTSGRTKSLIEHDFDWLGRGTLPGGFPLSTLIMVMFGLLFWYILTRRKFGTKLYAVGGNAEAAHVSGVNVSHIKLYVFLLNGALAAVAGLIISSRLGSANPSQGIGLELDGICAAILGGATLGGGKGSIWGAILGAITLVALRNGLNLIGISSSVQMFLVGFVILLILMLEVIQKRIRNRRIEK